MTITLTELQLSDLFFNHEKPALDSAYSVKTKDADLRQVYIEEALRKEATDFAALLGNQVDPQWLINDFNSRV